MRVERSRRARFDLDEFLARPLMAHLATSAKHGGRDSPLWYLWEDRALWFIVEVGYNTFQDRIADQSSVGVGVVDFDPVTGRLQHVGIRGRGRLVPWDDDRAARLLGRYYRRLRGYRDVPRAPGEPVGGRHRMLFVKVEPTSVVIREQSYREVVLASAGPSAQRPRTAPSRSRGPSPAGRSSRRRVRVGRPGSRRSKGSRRRA
jgi:hypothetical protein